MEHFHVRRHPARCRSLRCLQKGGYRQHLVQALAEAAGGLVPPLLLLPILRAKETGPTASLITLEVLEKVVDDSGRGIYGGSSGSVGGTATVTEGVIGERVRQGCASGAGVLDRSWPWHVSDARSLTTVIGRSTKLPAWICCRGHALRSRGQIPTQRLHSFHQSIDWQTTFSK